MPNFDFDEWSRRFLEEEERYRTQGQLPAPTPQPTSTPEMVWTPEELKCLEFQRWLLEHDVLTEFPGLSHDAGVARMHRILCERAAAPEGAAGEEVSL